VAESAITLGAICLILDEILARATHSLTPSPLPASIASCRKAEPPRGGCVRCATRRRPTAQSECG
jgi:hypothetical protein